MWGAARGRARGHAQGPRARRVGLVSLLRPSQTRLRPGVRARRPRARCRRAAPACLRAPRGVGCRRLDTVLAIRRPDAWGLEAHARHASVHAVSPRSGRGPTIRSRLQPPAPPAMSSGVPDGFEVLPSRVYVGNLAWAATDEDLRKAFSAVGTVTDAVVRVRRSAGWASPASRAAAHAAPRAGPEWGLGAGWEAHERGAGSSARQSRSLARGACSHRSSWTARRADPRASGSSPSPRPRRRRPPSVRGHTRTVPPCWRPGAPRVRAGTPGRAVRNGPRFRGVSQNRPRARPRAQSSAAPARDPDART